LGAFARHPQLKGVSSRGAANRRAARVLVLGLSFKSALALRGAERQNRSPAEQCVVAGDSPLIDALARPSPANGKIPRR